MTFPVDDKFIQDAENKLGAKLPNSYKERVRQNNGGDFEAMNDSWQLHPVFDTSDRKRIGKTSNHIVRETEVARQWSRFPTVAVAIAANGTGDRLIFLPKADGESQLGEAVHFWDHETGKVELIADDLADLGGGE